MVGLSVDEAGLVGEFVVRLQEVPKKRRAAVVEALARLFA